MKKQELEELVDNINLLRGLPLKAYEDTDKANHKSYHPVEGNPERSVGRGVYIIVQATGSYTFTRMSSKAGHTGHGGVIHHAQNRKDMHTFLRGYLAGYRNY